MRRMSRFILKAGRWAPALAVVALALCSPMVSGQLATGQVPEPGRGLDIEERLGEQVPLDLRLTTSEGEEVTLGSYFRKDRPVVLSLVYYDCPLLCGQIIDAMARDLGELDYLAGEDFQIVMVSFDPTNTREQAFNRKESALSMYGKPATPVIRRGWAFHLADKSTSATLAESVGFPYKYRPDIDEYSHGAVIFVLTPEGKISRYLFGLEFPERDLKLALLEASDGAIASGLGDYFLHLCYTWDPNANSYTRDAFMIMRIGSVLGAVLLAGLLVTLKLSERVRSYRAERVATASDDQSDSHPPRSIGTEG